PPCDLTVSVPCVAHQLPGGGNPENLKTGSPSSCSRVAVPSMGLGDPLEGRATVLQYRPWATRNAPALDDRVQRPQQSWGAHLPASPTGLVAPGTGRTMPTR